MMSLGKLEAGKTEYLLNSVAHGAEDYYTGSGEAAGEWLGGGLAGLGLVEGEEVTEEGLARILSAQDPTTGDSLVRGHAATRRVPGFDSTFSAPKSVSTLWALAPDEVREAVRKAHDDAVRMAMGYVESEMAWCRRGAGGATEVEGRGVVGAAFRHRSSRAGDPQLHSHVVVANLVQAQEDGRWGALTHTRLYDLAQTGGFLYQAELRQRLTESVGVQWSEVGESTPGVGEIEGVDPDLCRSFSQRAKEIEAAAAEQGVSSRAARQQVIMATRRPKPVHATERQATTWSEDAGDYGVEPSDSEGLYQRWQREAHQMGYSVDPAETLHQAEPVQPTEEQVQGWSDRLAGPEGLTESKTTFGRREAIRAWCEAPGATTSGAAEALSRADEWLSTDQVVPLEAHHRKAKFTTQDLLRCERRLVDSAEGRQAAGVGLADEEALAQALAGRPLSDEQRRMVESLVTSGAGVEVVIGRAGTGKTWALDAARDAWQSSGHTVIGCSLAARAAQELQDGAAIQSSTLARLLIAIRQEGGLQPGSVVVCDEAGMVGTRDLARLSAHVEQAGGKLVLVGDPHQLSEIDAGGALAHLAERLGHVELTEVHRQESREDIAALAELRHGSVEVGMEHLGRSATVSDTAPEAHAAMVADWWQARESGASAMMMTSRRRMAEELNSVARARMKEAGRLAPEALTVEIQPERVNGKRESHPPTREFSAGDEVMFGCNPTAKWKHLKQSFAGAHNGTRATVTGIDTDAGTVTVRLAGGDEAPEVVVPAEYAQAGHLAHGYASTIHRAQGATVDEAFVLGSDDMVRESGYVALSRHRVAAHLYVVAGGDEDLAEQEGPQEVQEEVDPLAQLTRSLGRSGAEEMASQQWSRSGVARGQAVRTLATRDMRTLAGEREALEATLIPEAERLAEADSISPDELVEAHRAATEAQAQAKAAEAARNQVDRQDRAGIESADAAARTAKYRAEQALAAYREARDRGAAEAARRRQGRDWLGVHGEDLTRLSELRAAEHRRQRLMGRAASALGEHPILGQVPESPRQRRRWERVAGEVEGYRERFGQDITTEVEGEDQGRSVERERIQAMVTSLSEPPARSEQESQVEAETTRRMTA